jgi:hypothetical protein
MKRNPAYKGKKYTRVSAGFGRAGRVPGRPSGSIGSDRANSHPVFCLDPARPQTRVARVPGRPAGPGRVLKHCLILLCE